MPSIAVLGSIFFPSKRGGHHMQTATRSVGLVVLVLGLLVMAGRPARAVHIDCGSTIGPNAGSLLAFSSCSV